ncbi:hypothetical protein VTK26DRAFT_8787 [Humicola hyalothermophila]
MHSGHCTDGDWTPEGSAAAHLEARAQFWLGIVGLSGGAVDLSGSISANRGSPTGSLPGQVIAESLHDGRKPVNLRWHWTGFLTQMGEPLRDKLPLPPTARFRPWQLKKRRWCGLLVWVRIAPRLASRCFPSRLVVRGLQENGSFRPSNCGFSGPATVVSTPEQNRGCFRFPQGVESGIPSGVRPKTAAAARAKHISRHTTPLEVALVYIVHTTDN